MHHLICYIAVVKIIESQEIKELSCDITNLDHILGSVIRSMDPDGEELCKLVNNLINSVSAQPGKKNDKEIENIISKLSNQDALKVVRVMSHYLNLANVAEQHHRVRRTRAHLIAEKPLIHSAEEILKGLIADGIAPEKIYGMQSVLLVHYA